LQILPPHGSGDSEIERLARAELDLKRLRDAEDELSAGGGRLTDGQIGWWLDERDRAKIEGRSRLGCSRSPKR
jgi:hypothetical protein